MKMYKIVVNAPGGDQEIHYVANSGGYNDQSKVIWDERYDGVFKQSDEDNLGGLIRSGKNLNLDQSMKDVQTNKRLAIAAAKKAISDNKQAMLVKLKAGTASISDMNNILADLVEKKI